MAKSSTKAQRNYSQIEKEALALVTAVERIKKFSWGRHFILQTDHQPLIVLFRPSQMKGMSERTATRLRRWALRPVGFDFEIEYVRTENFGQADALSRLIQEARSDATDPDIEEVIAAIDTPCEAELQELVVNALASDEIRETLVKETAKDPVLSFVIQRIQNPSERDKKNLGLRPYALVSDSLCITNGIFLNNERVVIPNFFKDSVLLELLRSHPGIRRMKGLARLHFYWPGMSTDIDRFVKGCSRCLETLKTGQGTT